ncbi:MAG: hypothetical protein QM708_04925 [Propioniciclava sp.]|uniref:hypothetical protein n=1 Tax=Propioniciclava sp. TaxID=2038686 RepID=UPI0039E2478A
MWNDGWYYCLVHKAVEPYEACRAAQRLGPYPTREDAAEALANAQARNDAWDNDPRFNDPDEDDDDYGTSAFDTFRP